LIHIGKYLLTNFLNYLYSFENRETWYERILTIWFI
jgi:hypothetical protein